MLILVCTSVRAHACPLSAFCRLLISCPGASRADGSLCGCGQSPDQEPARLTPDLRGGIVVKSTPRAASLVTANEEFLPNAARNVVFKHRSLKNASATACALYSIRRTHSRYMRNRGLSITLMRWFPWCWKRNAAVTLTCMSSFPL